MLSLENSISQPLDQIASILAENMPAPESDRRRGREAALRAPLLLLVGLHPHRRSELMARCAARGLVYKAFKSIMDSPGNQSMRGKGWRQEDQLYR